MVSRSGRIFFYEARVKGPPPKKTPQKILQEVCGLCFFLGGFQAAGSEN